MTAARDGEYRAASDRMLETLTKLRQVEQVKRGTETGTEEFVVLAREALILARDVYRWCDVQERLATESRDARAKGELSGQPLEHIQSRPIHRVLADWREAEHRLEQAVPESREAETAAADVDRLREEYRAAQGRRS